MDLRSGLRVFDERTNWAPRARMPSTRSRSTGSMLSLRSRAVVFIAVLLISDCYAAPLDEAADEPQARERPVSSKMQKAEASALNSEPLESRTDRQQVKRDEDGKSLYGCGSGQTRSVYGKPYQYEICYSGQWWLMNCPDKGYYDVQLQICVVNTRAIPQTTLSPKLPALHAPVDTAPVHTVIPGSRAPEALSLLLIPVFGDSGYFSSRVPPVPAAWLASSSGHAPASLSSSSSLTSLPIFIPLPSSMPLSAGASPTKPIQTKPQKPSSFLIPLPWLSSGSMGGAPQGAAGYIPYFQAPAHLPAPVPHPDVVPPPLPAPTAYPTTVPSGSYAPASPGPQADIWNYQTLQLHQPSATLQVSKLPAAPSPAATKPGYGRMYGMITRAAHGTGVVNWKKKPNIQLRIEVV